jgi:prepilin peptidase CpaA
VVPLLLNPEALAAALAVTGTGVAAAIDVRTRRVPNTLTATLALAGVTLAAGGLGPHGLLAALLGGLTGLALMLPGHVFGATGAGDVKLLAAAGTLLGAGATVRAFLFTAIAGGVLALAVAWRRRRVAHTLCGTARLVAHGRGEAAVIEAPGAGNRFAYAPAIAAGTAIVALGW